MRWVWMGAGMCAVGCGGTEDFGTGEPTDLSGVIDNSGTHPSCDEDDGLIQETPDEGDYRKYRNQGFDSYTEIVAPSGGVIPIFAEPEITEAQLLYARSVLRFFLTDTPGTTWGDSKSEVADSMADNGAVLMMPAGEHQEGNEPNLPAQPLYQDETQNPGSDWFMSSNYNHRDAAFEEIFHLVHDAGIGTYQPGALPEYQSDLDAEARAAIEDGRWGIPVDPYVEEWLEELEQEDSLAQEYIASVIDTYYGLWGAWDEADGGMWGVYIAKTRDEQTTLDPVGMTLLEQFLSEYITTEVRLDSELDTDFTLTFDADESYTHRSQYFTQVTLTGSNSVSLTGNELDNTLRGNSGDNTLDGGEGEDTVVLCDDSTDYTIGWDEETLEISGSNGSDRLVSVEWVHFADGRVAVSDL